MKGTSPKTTEGHSAFHRLMLIITLYLGLAMIAHEIPDIIQSRTSPMTTPNKTNEDDNNNNIININDSHTNMNANQQNARAYLGGNQRRRKGKKQQFWYTLNTSESPGTADKIRCTLHQDNIIHKKKKSSTTKSVTPIVVTKVKRFDYHKRASSLTNSCTATELHYETLHLRPWDIWLK